MHKLLRSDSLLSIFVLGGGNIFGTIISAITLIIFSRQLGPSEFGLFSAVFALMQIVVKLVDSGTTTATERALARAHAHTPARVRSLLTVAAVLKLGLYLFWSTLGFFAASFLAHNYLKIPDTTLIRQAILLSLGTVIFEYSTIAFQSAGRFGLVARITLAQATGKLLGGLLLLFNSALNATTALWLYALMPALGSLAGWLQGRVIPVGLAPVAWKQHSRLILSVAKWTSIATIAATFADNLDTLIVQSLLNLHDTGIWSASARIAAFAQIIPWTIGSVLNIRVTRFHERRHLMAYLKKAKIIGLASALIIALALPFSGLALTLTVGPAYLSGTTALMLMLISTSLTALTTPYAALYYLFDKPQYYAYAGIISTVLLITLDYLLIPLYGLTGAGITRIITRFAVLLFTFLYTRAVVAKLPLKNLRAHE